MRDRIVAAISLGVGWIAEKHTWKGARSELMRSGGSNARVAKATEDAKVVIGGWRAKEEVVGRVVPAGAARTNVNEKSGGGKSIRPKPRRHMGMEQKGANTIIEGAEDAFGTTVLLRGVRTCET